MAALNGFLPGQPQGSPWQNSPISPCPKLPSGASHLFAATPLLPRACSTQKTMPFSAQCGSLEGVS